MAHLRKLTKKTLIVVNAALGVVFLLACTNAYANPASWWMISLLGLFFPLLLLLVFAFFIFWLFFPSRRLALVSLLALAMGWSNIHAFFAFNIRKPPLTRKPADALRILTWNVHSWDEFITSKPGASGHRGNMLEFIRQQDADLLCFQEFFESHNFRGLSSTISYITTQLHYPYYLFSRDFKRFDGQYESGDIIFSKYPITDSLLVKFRVPHSTKYQESLLAIDLTVQGKKIRVFTTHLQSVLFQRRDFRNLEIIRNVDDSVLEASRSIVKKLKVAYALRSDQAKEVRHQLDQSPYPAIICGDFNDIPNSYTYFHIRGDMQDAFTKKGFGIGRTYVNLSPTLRIDYILVAKEFQVLHCSKFSIPYSDHHPVVADLRLL